MQEQIAQLMSSEYPLTLKHLLTLVIFLEEGKTELIRIRMIMTLMLWHHQRQLEFTCPRLSHLNYQVDYIQNIMRFYRTQFSK